MLSLVTRVRCVLQKGMLMNPTRVASYSIYNERCKDMRHNRELSQSMKNPDIREVQDTSSSHAASADVATSHVTCSNALPHRSQQVRSKTLRPVDCCRLHHICFLSLQMAGPNGAASQQDERLIGSDVQVRSDVSSIAAPRVILRRDLKTLHFNCIAVDL